MEATTATLDSAPASSDADSIRQVLTYYAEGLRTGDVDLLKQAFHPQSIMTGYFGGDLILTPIEGFYDLVRNSPAPSVSGEPYAYEIGEVDVIGDTATAEVSETSLLGHDFADRFHLVRIDGRWQIVSKIFSVTGVAQPG
jgi:hypothetical protein